MNPVHVRLDQNHMATTFSLQVSCAPHETARAEHTLLEAHELITRLERELSEFFPASPIHALNHARPNERVTLPASARALLAHSARLREATGGCFDCTAKSARGSAGVAFDEACGWRLDADARVGFGAIGKGYAIDQARGLVEREGFRNYLFNAGGSSLVLSGFSARGKPWNFGWSWSKDTDGDSVGIPLSHYRGDAVAIGVSGTHEKGLHVIDPRTGATVDGLASALVAHPSAADADALSTALFVSGWQQGLENMKDLPASIGVAAIDRAGVPRWNGVFQKFWGSLALLALVLAPAAFADDAPAAAPSTLVSPAAEAGAAPAADSTDEVIDLGDSRIADSFTPYVFSRNPWWAALPVLSLALVLLHLRKPRIPPKTTQSKV